MSKKNKQDIDSLISSVNKLHKFKSRLILGVIITVVVAVIIAFLIIVIGSESQDIIDAYNNISGPPHDSKQQFGTKNIKITVTSDGKLEIELVTAKDKDDNSVTGTSDSDPGTPDGDADGGSSGGSDDNSGGNGGGEDAGPEPPKNISATDEEVIQFFVGKGYSRDASIGIAANLKAESSYNYAVVSQAGYKGIAQWSSDRWSCYQSYLSSINASDSLGAQLEFVYMEMNNISPATDQYSSKLSVSNFNSKCSGKYYATKLVSKYYERCGTQANGYKVSWDGTNSSTDSQYLSTCQGGQDRINNAASMN